MRQATCWFLCLYALVPLLWTAAAWRFSGYEATITAVLRDVARVQPLIIAGLSALFTSLLWHWFGGKG